MKILFAGEKIFPVAVQPVGAVIVLRIPDQSNGATHEDRFHVFY